MKVVIISILVLSISCVVSQTLTIGSPCVATIGCGSPNLICSNGLCAQTCKQRSNCPNSQLCTNGVCKTIPQRTKICIPFCAKGQVCSSTGICTNICPTACPANQICDATTGYKCAYRNCYVSNGCYDLTASQITQFNCLERSQVIDCGKTQQSGYANICYCRALSCSSPCLTLGQICNVGAFGDDQCHALPCFYPPSQISLQIQCSDINCPEGSSIICHPSLKVCSCSLLAA